MKRLLKLALIDMKLRFKGSLFGSLWGFINPIILFLIYFIVFVFIIKVKLGDGVNSSFSFYLVSGLFPWLVFNEALIRGVPVFVENAHIISKLPISYELLVAKVILSTFILYIPVFLFIGIYAVYNMNISFFNIFLYLIIILYLMLISYFLSAVLALFYVYIRDVLQVLNLLLLVLLYATPILYPVNIMPDILKKLEYLNPFYYIIGNIHSLLIYNKLDFIFFAGEILILLFIAFFYKTIYIKHKSSIPDLL